MSPRDSRVGMRYAHRSRAQAQPIVRQPRRRRDRPARQRRRPASARSGSASGSTSTRSPRRSDRRRRTRPRRRHVGGPGQPPPSVARRRPGADGTGRVARKLQPRPRIGESRTRTAGVRHVVARSRRQVARTPHRAAVDLRHRQRRLPWRAVLHRSSLAGRDAGRHSGSGVRGGDGAEGAARHRRTRRRHPAAAGRTTDHRRLHRADHRRGRRGAGRTRPRIIAAVPVLVTSDVDAGRAAAAEQLGFYAAIPSYRRVIAREGVDHVADLAAIGSPTRCAAT